MTTLKTPDEIVEYLNGPEIKNDILDFTREVLFDYLPFSHVQPWLKEDVEYEDWNPHPIERPTIVEQMRKYAQFGWGKIQDHREISAGRTVQKMAAWLCLLG